LYLFDTNTNDAIQAEKTYGYRDIIYAVLDESIRSTDVTRIRTLYLVVIYVQSFV